MTPQQLIHYVVISAKIAMDCVSCFSLQRTKVCG